jgi:hypothetical protein
VPQVRLQYCVCVTQYQCYACAKDVTFRVAECMASMAECMASMAECMASVAECMTSVAERGGYGRMHGQWGRMHGECGRMHGEASMPNWQKLRQYTSNIAEGEGGIMTNIALV